ncbi:MAG: hypothetical protein ACRDNS_00590 [Trebonia sp.]
MTTVPVEVDDELLKLADAQAAEAGRPRSDVLAAALRRGLGGGPAQPPSCRSAQGN